MNKQQFIEKCKKEFRDKYVVRGCTGHYPKCNGCIDIVRNVDEAENFLQLKLSECWDMAGEEGEKNEDRALEERDNAEDWADQLANDIGAVTGIDIGEHSNMNNPWANALEALHTYFDSLTSK